MKNIVEKLILAFAFLFSSIQVTSAEHLSKGKILEIRADEDGRIEIVRESPTHPEECSNAKDFYFFSDEETSSTVRKPRRFTAGSLIYVGNNSHCLSIWSRHNF